MKGTLSNQLSNLDLRKWCIDNNINELFNIDMDNYGAIDQKHDKDVFQSVDPDNMVAMPPELDDLTRLHFLARTRKVCTVLEFGIGKSTSVFAQAMKQNKEEYESFVSENLRCTTPFEVHSIDAIKDWIDVCKKDLNSDLQPYVTFHHSEVEMTTFNDRICTAYKELPNLCPDLIYLDAPDQYSIEGDVRGISTRTKDRFPMAADLLMLEPFLLPGTLIVVDGRTANARFLKNNFQRDWEYFHMEAEDIHTFELVESPLGRINKVQMEFCLGGVYK